MICSRLGRLKAAKIYSVAVLLTVMSGLAFCQTPFDSAFQQADSQVIRLSPSRFPQLPLAIRQELHRRGCTIPQVWEKSSPHNVIEGAFIQQGELDWAVLCSVHRISSILIFRNASTSHVIELARGADINVLQSEGGVKIGYSRQIDPVGGEFILRHYHAYGGVKPPLIDHQGINDAFVGKASVVLYDYRGKWLTLTGAD